MSGSVFVNIEEKNKTNGKKFIRTAAVLDRGSLFGVSSDRNLIDTDSYEGGAEILDIFRPISVLPHLLLLVFVWT